MGREVLGWREEVGWGTRGGKGEETVLGMLYMREEF